MKAFFVSILFLNLMAANLFAQQCSYENYYLFVIDVHTKNSSAKLPDLKIYLVDEQDKPVMASGSYLVGNQWMSRSDTLFFWEHALLKNGAGISPLFRQKFFNLGDFYVVAFHLDDAKLKDPQSYPIYKVKIEDDFNNWFIETNVHLPLQKAVRICNNGITNDFPLVNPVQTLDGKNFEPIDIVLDQPQVAMEVEKPKDELLYTVRFDYQTLSTVNEGMDEYLLNGAKIYNTQTGKLHQEIYIPRISKSMWKESKNIVKFVDFYNRGITEAIDFSVQIESWRDLEIMGYRQKLNYYIFNTTTKQYELDTALSNYNDVFYYEPLKTMRRYDFKVTAKSRTTYTYQFENKKWALIDKNEVFFESPPPPPPKIKYPSSNCISVNEKSHMLPLHAVIGNEAKILVKDTFWLYNICDDTLFISKVESGYRDFFSINQTLLPQQPTPLIFNGILINSSFDFTTKEYNCNLILADGSVISLGIIIPMVSNNATVYYRADSTVNYAVGNQPKARFCTAIFTYPSGQLRAKGTVQDMDTSLKVGNWLYFKEGTLGSEQLIYSKAISLTAFDDIYSYEHNNFKVKVLENGNWKEPVADVANNQIRFFITPKTDSIIAYTDTTSYGFSLPYKNLPVEIKKQFYLLIPNERTLKIGYYEMPFKVYKDQYAIVLNYSHFKTHNKTTYQLTDSIIAALQKLYPDIATVWISTNQRGINLQGLAYETREKVLEQLARDSSVAIICQLFSIGRQQRLGYCNNRVYAYIDIEDADKFRKTAQKLGFSNIESDLGNNRFWLTYPDKLIDEGFFESFDRLTREKLVFGAFFNFYFEPELDVKITE
jgi:hypothetical protein